MSLSMTTTNSVIILKWVEVKRNCLAEIYHSDKVLILITWVLLLKSYFLTKLSNIIFQIMYPITEL